MVVSKISNEYKDWIKDKVDENKVLCEKYPFLYPRNVFTDILPDDYDYSYTWLDAMPDGWRVAFGERMCSEIRDALARADCLRDYRIYQIKEKFGELRWYSNYETDEVGDIITKYSYISGFICIVCGKPYPNARMVNAAWISPYCKECYNGSDYDSISSKNDISNSITISGYRNGQRTERHIDVKNTWDSIVSDYNKLHGG
jgi:hypothetical protein